MEDLKKIRAQASIFSMSEREDLKGEYIDPIPSPNLTTNPKSKPRTTPTTKPDLSQGTKVPAFGTNIAQPIFMLSPSLEATATNDVQLEFEHNGEKNGDTVPLDLPSPRSPTFEVFNKKMGSRKECR